MLRKIVWYLLLLAFLLSGALILPVVGEEAVTLPEAYGDLSEHIPPEVEELLPEGLLSENAEEALEAACALSDWQYLLHVFLGAVGLRLDDAVTLLCTLMGLILVAAVMGKLKEGIGGTSGELFGFCLRLALYTAICLQTVAMLERVQIFFTQLTALMGGMIPVMGVLYALGGNAGQAAASQEMMLVFLGVCEYVSAVVTPPVCAVCMSFSLMDAFGLRMTLSPLCGQIKRWYVSLLGLLTFLLSLALSAQSVLVGRVDSMGMRGLKYAVGNLLPVVGGAIAGTLGTVSAGVSLLRGVAGTSGILLLMLLLLPTLAELLILRATLSLSASGADLLGCDGEARLLREIASLHGYLAAAVSMCSVVFVLALALLVHGAVAVAA